MVLTVSQIKAHEFGPKIGQIIKNEVQTFQDLFDLDPISALAWQKKCSRKDFLMDFCKDCWSRSNNKVSETLENFVQKIVDDICHKYRSFPQILKMADWMFAHLFYDDSVSNWFTQKKAEAENEILYNDLFVVDPISPLAWREKCSRENFLMNFCQDCWSRSTNKVSEMTLENFVQEIVDDICRKYPSPSILETKDWMFALIYYDNDVSNWFTHKVDSLHPNDS
jgi:hypothetical protein